MYTRRRRTNVSIYGQRTTISKYESRSTTSYIYGPRMPSYSNGPAIFSPFSVEDRFAIGHLYRERVLHKMSMIITHTPPVEAPDTDNCQSYIQILEKEKAQFITLLASLNDSEQYNYTLQRATIHEILAVLNNGIRKLNACRI